MTVTEPVGKDLSLSAKVAEEIRVALARRNMTRAQLARATGLSEASISRKLTGTRAIDLDELAMIARALGVPAHKLLPDESHEAPSGSKLPKSRPAERPTPTAPPSARPPDTRPAGRPRTGDRRPPTNRTSRVRRSPAGT